MGMRRRLGLCLSVAALLAGCVSTRPLAETKLPPGESGAVVLKVVSDGYSGSLDLARYIVSARIRREGTWTNSGPSRVRLVRAEAVTNSSAMLGGVVEPGLYSLVSLEASLQNYSFEDNALRFEVKPGATTLLGTLIFHGRNKLPKHLPADADAGSLETMEQSFPTLFGGQSAKRELVLQVSSSLPEARLSAHELKRQVRLADDWVQLETGDFAAPGRLGTVFYRKKGSSKRQVIDAGDWRETLSVASIKRGLLIAGEEGLLRFSPDGGSTWQALSPPARGLIRAIHSTGQDSAAAVVRTGTRWAVYATPDVFAGAWRRVAEFSFGDLPADEELSMPLVVPLPNGFGVMQMRGGFRYVDLSGQIRESSLPFQNVLTRRYVDQGGQMRESTTGKVVNMTATQDGLLMLRKSQTVGTSVSADEGKTWSDLKLPYSTLIVAFQDRHTFFAIAAVPGTALPQQFATYVTRDAGANWSRSGTSPVEPGQALRFWASPAGALQIELEGGGVMQSTDAGLSWARLPG